MNIMMIDNFDDFLLTVLFPWWNDYAGYSFNNLSNPQRVKSLDIGLNIHALTEIFQYVVLKVLQCPTVKVL